ncbi:MAG: DUF3793 family protein [Eubacteriales bacterium]|nr:DUF3793 family protein [Eubacteriales bacterium]
MGISLRENIVHQCSPVLMDVKPSNLLILTRDEEREYQEMAPLAGISSRCLHRGEQKSVWFLYRKDRLEAKLLWPCTRGFLQTCGYRSEEGSLEEMLERLTERFRSYKEGSLQFPHEMGVFLGYPLCDVKGFIEHGGKNYLCSGYWKVYEDAARAQKTFRLYEAVRDAALQMISAGSDLYEISCQAY